MKRKLQPFSQYCLILILTVCFSSVQAQKIQIAIKAGPQYSCLFGNMQKQEGTRPLPSWHVGLNLDFKLSSKFSLQSGAELSNKGYSRNAQDMSFTESNQPPTQLKTLYYYLDLPVLLNFALVKNFKAGLGLTPSVFLSQTNVVNKQTYYVDGGNYKNYLSATASLSYDIHRFQTGLRYSVAVTNYGQHNYEPWMLLQTYLSFRLNQN